jgi:hypothetical protein
LKEIKRGGEGSDGFRGKKHTQETKDKLRLISTGRTLTIEQRNKISENNKRRGISEETKLKISLKLKEVYKNKKSDN